MFGDAMVNQWLEEKTIPGFVLFTDFHGVNTATTVDFKLPTV